MVKLAILGLSPIKKATIIFLTFQSPLPLCENSNFIGALLDYSSSWSIGHCERHDGGYYPSRVTLALFPSQRQQQNANLDWIQPSLVSNRLLNNLDGILLHVEKMRRRCLAMCPCYFILFSANFWSVEVVLLELCKKRKRKFITSFLQW